MARIQILLFPLLNLLAILSFSILATNAWEVDLYSDSDCIVPVPGHGIVAQDGSICISVGGGSWEVTVEAGCSFYSYSGNNCRGSSYQSPLGYVNNCWSETPFASIQVIC